MDTKALRKLKNEDLSKRLIEKTKELDQKKYEQRLGKDNNFAGIKELRKEIARIKTLIAENLEN